jgi:hypothetical protein
MSREALLILLHEAISPPPNGIDHANKSIKVLLETSGDIGVYSDNVLTGFWDATTGGDLCHTALLHDHLLKCFLLLTRYCLRFDSKLIFR